MHILRTCRTNIYFFPFKSLSTSLYLFIYLMLIRIQPVIKRTGQGLKSERKGTARAFYHLYLVFLSPMPDTVLSGHVGFHRSQVSVTVKLSC